MNDYGKRTETGTPESRRGFGSMFDWEPFRGFFPGNWQNMIGIDVRRSENGYEIEMAVPGFRPDDLEINYQDGVITVSGRNERRNFTRSITVPEDVDEENIDAHVEHGMLVLTLRQHPKRQPRRITVGSSRTTQQEPSTTTGSTSPSSQKTSSTN